MQKIVIVEDEKSLADTVAFNLREEGYAVCIVGDGLAALETIRREKPDLVLLDVMLPGVDGLEICRLLRRQSEEMPVIMLTAKAREIDKVIGLEIGADDYISKPFGMMELIARIRAMLRRSKRGGVESEVYRGHGIELDVAKHQVTVQGKTVDLRPKEFELLRMLMAYPGRVLERATLLDQVWGEDEFLDQGTLDVHIRRLREKIEENPGTPMRILTIRGVGYKFADS